MQYTQRALLLPEAFSAKEAVDFMRTYTVLSDEELAEADESTRQMDSSSLEVLYVKRANGTLGQWHGKGLVGPGVGGKPPVQCVVFFPF